jgi:hypothetical protein
MTIRVVYATTTKPVQLQVGTSGVIQKGTHWPADDPIVLAHPEVFSDDPRWGMNYSREPAGYDAPIEQATAGPGERRATIRPRADEAMDEMEELRSELTRLGVTVDGRWSLKRLREEMEKVGQRG